MESLRKEIEDEMKRARLDKDRLYDLLLKIVDSGASASGPQGPQGPQGPEGQVGPAGECKCQCHSTDEVASDPEKKVANKKVVTKKAI